MATASRALEWRFPPALLVAFVLAALRFIQRLRPGGPAARFPRYLLISCGFWKFWVSGAVGFRI